MFLIKSLEAYNSIFSIAEENNNLVHYTYTFDVFSFTEFEDELEGFLKISDNTPYHLQHEKIGLRIIKAYKKSRSEKSSTDGYIILLSGYAGSPFRDFESYFKIVVELVEDDIQLIFEQYNSNYVTYEIVPGFCSNQDISEAVRTMGDHEGTLKTEYDDINIKTKLISTCFGGNCGMLRFDERFFSGTLLGFTPFWYYTPSNAVRAGSPGVNFDKKILNLSTIDENHLKCDVIDGSVVNGIRKPILFSFVLDKPSGYKVFCKPETRNIKKRICFEYYNFFFRRH